MLFDLRGRGRRRTVKVVYILLAVLMGGGLVLFGIGGGGAMSGGLVDAITGSSGGDTGTQRFTDNERKALVLTQQKPSDPVAWAALARARVQTAGVGDNFDPNTAAYTDSGKAKLAEAAQAWDKYLALDPKNPDDRVASLMVRAYDQTGLNRPEDAVKAQEIITEARPKATTFATLAIYAYQAGQTRKGDLATQKALSLAPKDQKNTLKSQLDQAKQAAVQAQVQQQAQNATPTPTASPKKKK